nr:hypothetical protein [Tanacetum cinerariifolium]
MILRDGDERLTLNMRHDTSSYSNQPQRESINMFNIFNDSSEDFLEDLFSTNQPSGNPTFSSHPELTSLKVKDDIFDPEGGNVLSEKLLDLDPTKDLHPPLHVNPLSGSTTYSFSPNQLLEMFTDEHALDYSSPPIYDEYDDNIRFDIESDLKEIEYLLHHDPIKDLNSSFKDLIDQSNLANPTDNFVDSLLEMFTEEHALDYSSPPIFDEYDDDFLEVESDTENVYDDPFDSKGEKIKESKLLIDELDLPCDFLLPFNIPENLKTLAKGFYPLSLKFLSFNWESFLVYCYGQNYNEEAQLHVKVDGQKIIVTKSSVRRDLQLADEEDKAIHKELGDRLVRAATITSSLEAEQDNDNISKTQSKATPNEPSFQGTNSGCGPRCQETIGDTISQTRFERVSKQSNDSLLARGNTLQRNEDSLKLDELMALCTTLQNRVFDLEKTTTTQHNEIDSLERRVKNLEKKNRSRTHRLKRLYKVGLMARVDTSGNKESLGEDTSKQGRMPLMLMMKLPWKKENVVEEVVDAAQVSTAATTLTITTEEITLAQGLKALKTSKPKDDIQAKIDADHQFTERLQEQEQEELSDVENATLFQQLLEKRRKHFTAKRAKEKRNKPPTKAQQRKIIAFKKVNTFEDFRTELLKGKEKRAGEELVQEITKKQKVEDDKEKAELKQLIEIILDEGEVAIVVIPLAVKEDLEDLYKLVKARYGSTRPAKSMDYLLWSDMKIMFEPHIEDEVWKLQNGYKVLEWKYDSRGVHYLMIQSMQIYMLVEKKYYFTPPTLLMMLEKKLIIDYESEMAYQLLKLIKKQPWWMSPFSPIASLPEPLVQRIPLEDLAAEFKLQTQVLFADIYSFLVVLSCL